ncbi:MAG: tetratricopeptide repeat protein [Nitrospirota bacterium]
MRRTLAICLTLLATWALPAQGLADQPQALQDAWAAYRAVVASATDDREVVTAARSVSEAARASAIDQFPSLSFVMLRDADVLLARGNTDAATDLARMAAALSPNSAGPHAWLAAVSFTGSNPDVVDGVTEWASGLTASYRDFWSLLYRINRWMAAAILSLLSATAVVMAVLMIRAIPLLGHLIIEWSGHRLFRPTAWLVAAWTVVAPLAAVRWGAWFMLAPGVVVWWFLSRRERVVVTVVAGIGLAAAVALPYAVPLFIADQSAEFRLAVEVAEGRDPSRALVEADLVDSPRGAAARASALENSGRIDDARTLFEEAVVRWPADPRVLTQYGNLRFRRGEYADAASLYERALATAPDSVAVLYNLSQAQRADLRFEEGETHFQQARAINARLLDRYAERARRNDLLLVTDYPSTTSELLSDARQVRPSSPQIQAALSEILRQVSLPVAFGVLALVVGCWVLGRWFPNQPASPCETCGVPVCQRCQRYFLDLKLCSACWQSYAKGVTVTPRTTLPQVARRWETRRRWASFLAVIPGAGHVSIGCPWLGALLAFFGSWLIWVGILGEVGWNTLGAKLSPMPWYVTWGPIGGGFCVAGIVAIYHLWTLRWQAAGSSWLPQHR